VHDVIRANSMKNSYKQPANETVTETMKPRWANNYTQSQPIVTTCIHGVSETTQKACWMKHIV